MTQSVSMLTKIILVLLVLLLFIHFYTGSVFDFTTHQIDKIFNFDDKDKTGQSTVSQTISLAQKSGILASKLADVMQSNQKNCLHRSDMFSKDMFETNDIRFTSQGQTTRIEVLPKSGGVALTSAEIGQGVRLCTLHDIAEVEQLKDIISGSSQAQSGLQGLNSPSTVSTIELSTIDKRGMIRSSDNRIHFTMTTSSLQDPIRIRNIEENKYLYFLKIDNNLCLIPVSTRTLIRRSCLINDGMLKANCVDGSRSPPLSLERLYEDIENIKCEI